MLNFFYRIQGRILSHKYQLSISHIALLMIILSCIFLPFFLQYDIHHIDYSNILSHPSYQHIMGTDMNGRDIFVRMLYGGKISIILGISVAFFAGIIGTIYGIISGFIGGKTDLIMMRVIEMIYSLPILIVLLIIMPYTEHKLLCLIIVMSCLEWLMLARIVRAKTIIIRNSQFIFAIWSLGASNTRIIFKYILPCVYKYSISCVGLLFPYVILSESSLSYIGIGLDDNNPSWGQMIANSIDLIHIRPELLLIVTGIFAVTVISISNIFDSMHEYK